MLPPQITTASLPNAVLNQSYTTTLTATGDGNKTWSLIDSNLPNGMSLSSSGVISGTPTEFGDFELFIQVSSPYGTNTRAFILKVSGPPTIITPSNLPDGGDSATYSYILKADGTPPIS